jgi:hypothetical protein
VNAIITRALAVFRSLIFLTESLRLS